MEQGCSNWSKVAPIYFKSINRETKKNWQEFVFFSIYTFGKFFKQGRARKIYLQISGTRGDIKNRNGTFLDDTMGSNFPNFDWKKIIFSRSKVSFQTILAPPCIRKFKKTLNIETIHYQHWSTIQLWDSTPIIWRVSSFILAPEVIGVLATRYCALFFIFYAI